MIKADVLADIPYPNFTGVLGNEKRNQISDLLSSLYSEITNLQGCIALFDHSLSVQDNLKRPNITGGWSDSPERGQGERVVRRWPFIAAREALSILYNFHWALKELNSVIVDISKIDTLINPKPIEATLLGFEKQFNKALLARHAASHRTEIKSNFDKNAHKAGMSNGPIVKPKGASVMISGCLMDRTYTETRKGELLTFDVTWETYSSILKTYTDVIGALSPDNPYDFR